MLDGGEVDKKLKPAWAHKDAGLMQVVSMVSPFYRLAMRAAGSFGLLPPFGGLVFGFFTRSDWLSSLATWPAQPARKQHGNSTALRHFFFEVLSALRRQRALRARRHPGPPRVQKDAPQGLLGLLGVGKVCGKAVRRQFELTQNSTRFLFECGLTALTNLFQRLRGPGLEAASLSPDSPRRRKMRSKPLLQRASQGLGGKALRTTQHSLKTFRILSHFSTCGFDPSRTALFTIRVPEKPSATASAAASATSRADAAVASGASAQSLAKRERALGRGGAVGARPCSQMELCEHARSQAKQRSSALEGAPRQHEEPHSTFLTSVGRCKSLKRWDRARFG